MSAAKIFKNAGVLLAGNAGASVFAISSIVVFTNSQGVLIFGYFVIFMTYIEIIDRLLNFQTWQAFIKFASEFEAKDKKENVVMLLKNCFIIDLASLLPATAVAILLSGIVIKYFEIPGIHHNLLLLLSISIIFKIADISTGVFRLYDKFKIQAKIELYSSAAKFIMFLCVALLLPEFEMFIYAAMASQFLSMVLKLKYLKKILNENKITLSEIAREKINIQKLKKINALSFIIYNNFDVSIRMLSRQIDTILIGRVYGPEAVGVYKIVKEVANIMAKLTDPVYQSIYPEFAKMLANNKKNEARQIAKKVSLYGCVTGAIFYILFVAIGERAIQIVFGNGFLGAYHVTLIYFIAIYIGIVTLPLYPMQHAFGYAKEAFFNQLYATALYIPVLIAATLSYGMIGASLAYIIYYIFLTGMTLRSVRKGFQEI